MASNTDFVQYILDQCSGAGEIVAKKMFGDYTYYDDVDGADQFEKHVTHFYDFIGDRLIIGKFCAIAKGVEFVMNGANHRMDCVTTYPFYVIGGDWGSAIAPVKDELPLKGDTVATYSKNQAN